MSIFTTPPLAFALDISSGSAKVVQLKKSGRSIVLDFALEVSLPPDMVVGGEVAKPDALREVLSSLLAPVERQLANGVIASLSEAKTFFECIRIPKTPGSTFEKALAETLPQYVPLPLEESFYATQTTNDTTEQWSVVVGAAPRQTIERLLASIEGLRKPPLAIDIEAAAITRAIMRVLPLDDKGPTIIVDLGKTHASLIVIDEGIPQMTLSIPIIGDAVTAEIAQALSITAEEAEKQKIACGLHTHQCDGPAKDVLVGMVHKLASHITETATYYQDHFARPAPVNQIILCGGGAHISMIDQALGRVSKLPVSISNVWADIVLPPSGLPENHLGYTTALGLALRAVDGSL
jgi:type IV pilus assembly protein PilM